ncbi:MAG: DUF6531 domain-containing protein [Bacteroidota bacterium]
MPRLKKLTIVLGCIGSFALASSIAFSQDKTVPQGHRREITEARTEYTKTYEEDGATVLHVSTVPLHYTDQNNKWQEIDVTLEAASGEADDEGNAYAHKVVRNSFATYFPRHGNGWVELRRGNTSLAFKLLGSGSRQLARRNKGELAANDILADCDLAYTVKPGGLKEDIVLKRPRGVTFEYLIRLRNLTVSRNQDGEYVFKDINSQAGFIMSRFVMYDAKKAWSTDIDVQLEPRGNEYRLAVTPSTQWLTAPERVYPVTIDPTYRISMDCDHGGGDRNVFYMYMPCSTPQNTSFGPAGNSNYYPINYPDAMNGKIKPYETRAWYTVWVGNYEGAGYTADPYFKVTDVNPAAPINPSQTSARGTERAFEQFHNGTRTGEFDIQANQGILVEMFTGSDFHGFIFGTWCGFECWFEIKYQNETISPPAPGITLLPPETYGTSVTLNWTTPTDEKNPDAPPGTNASGIAKYFVQRSTDSNFTTNVVLTEVGNVNSKEFTGLSIGTTYYFRVYAQDNDGNPRDVSGARWSSITRTKCVQAPPSGGPAKPTIVDITSDAAKPVNLIGDERFTAEKNPRIHYTYSTGQQSVQINISELPAIPKTLNEYPVITLDTTDTSAPTNWNLPDGRYVVYVRVANNVSWSEWSKGKIIIIDTTPPSAPRIVDETDGGSVNLKLLDAIGEKAKYELYWGTSPDSLTNYQATSGYDDYPANKVIPVTGMVPGQRYYYRFTFMDMALNATTTPIYSIGGSNNIANADPGHYGLESYWNYQSTSLGRAGTAQVNLNNGNLLLSATDFALPGRGIPITISRYYSSLATFEGMLGKGWRSSFEFFIQIDQTDGKSVFLNDPDGSSHRFAYVSDTQFTRPPGDYRKVVKNTGDGTYTVKEKDGTYYRFGVPQNGLAKLIAIEDRFGNILTVTYNDNGRLASVREPSGYRRADFHYATLGGKQLLERVDFFPLEEGTMASRYVRYEYFCDHNGVKLTKVCFPYDDSQESAVEYGYDSVLGLLSSSAVLLGADTKNSTSYAYKNCTRSIASIATHFMTYQPNFSDIYHPNAPTASIDVVYRYDYDGATTTVTDPRGGVYTYVHFPNGQLQSVLGPTQTNPVTYTYDADFNVRTVTQKKLVYADGTETPRDVVTEYNYFSNGNLSSVIVDKGTGTKNLTTSITYEAVHRDVETDIKSITDPRANVTNYSYIYDAGGKLTEMTITSPDDYFIVHSFDAYGQRTTKDVKLKSNPSVSKYHFGYGYEYGLLNTLTNAYGTTTYYHTVYGERKSILDANGIEASIRINPYTGTMVKIEVPTVVTGSGFLPFDPLPPLGPRAEYTYDANGNKTSDKDAKGHVTTYFYDELNHLYHVQSPPNIGVAHYDSYNRYDANGNLLETRDYAGNHTTYTYDALNRRTHVIDATTATQEELVYDETGRVKIRYDGKGNKTEYFYDSVDNLVYEKYYEGTVLKHTVSYTYDNNGNLLSKTVPLSSLEETGTIVTNYQYDALNRPTSVTTTCAQNSKYNQTIGYTYEAGQLKTMTVSNLANNPGSYTYTYNYDAAQRLDTLISPSNQKIDFDYYPGGQRLKKSIYNQSSDSTPFMTVDYKYDVAYRLRNIDYQWQPPTYTYYLKMSYKYNEIDKITDNTAENKDNWVQYNINAPDVVNFLLSQQPDGYSLPNITQPLQGDYTNDYQYDDLGRLTYSEVHGITPGIKWEGSTTYVRGQRTSNTTIDANGNPTYKRIDTFDGTDWKATYTTNNYNALNQLSYTYVNAPGSEDDYHVTPYNYDYNGNLTSEHYDDGRPIDSTYQYGLDDQLLRSLSQTKHKYEESTWCYNRTEKKYAYELGGKLLRTKSIIHDSTNRYDIWDANYDDYFYYSHDGVIAERHDDISSTTIFTRWGRELLTTGSSIYIQNIRGDVVMIVGSDGNVKTIRDYDATGQLLCQAPRDRDPFGFIGGLDAGNGLWKLGARFYDSGKGSFIQQDRYLGDPGDPLSLNRYVYCGLDPVNFVDPTGLSPQVYHVENERILDRYTNNLSKYNNNILKVGLVAQLLDVTPVAPLSISFGLYCGAIGIVINDRINFLNDCKNYSYYTVEGPDENGLYHVEVFDEKNELISQYDISKIDYDALMDSSEPGQSVE